MTKELRELVGFKKRLWYKCRHSGFKQTEMITESKNLNKNVKNRVKMDIRTFELNLAKNSTKNPQKCLRLFKQQMRH